MIPLKCECAGWGGPKIHMRLWKSTEVGAFFDSRERRRGLSGCGVGLFEIMLIFKRDSQTPFLYALLIEEAWADF